MRNQAQHGDSAEGTLEDTFRSASSEPTSLAGTTAAPANYEAGPPRSDARGETLRAAGPLSGDSSTGWDPWEVWLRDIEQPRRRRRVTAKRKR